MIEFVGQFTLGGCVPGAVQLGLLGFANLESDLAALLLAQASIGLTPPQLSFQANIDVALEAVASLQASIDAGITPPSINVQLDLMAAAIAAVQAQLQLVANLMIPFNAVGVWSYTYSGAADQFGPEFTMTLSGGLPSGGGASEHIDAIVLATNVGPTWAAIQTIFAT